MHGTNYVVPQQEVPKSVTHQNKNNLTFLSLLYCFTALGKLNIEEPIFIAYLVLLNCVVPENIPTPTMEGIGNSRRVGGEGVQRPRKFWRGGGGGGGVFVCEMVKW